MNKCPICKEWRHGIHHRCAPKWVCQEIDEWEPKPTGDYDPDDEYGIYEIHARDSQEAAEKRFSGMSDWYEQDSMRVIVIKVDDVIEDDNGKTIWPDGKYKTFDVMVEAVPEFTATEI